MVEMMEYGKLGRLKGKWARRSWAEGIKRL